MLPVVGFGLNNAVHSATVHTLFYVKGAPHPRVPLTLPLRDSGLSGVEMFVRLANNSPATV